jgi:hypothetical protein
MDGFLLHAKRQLAVAHDSKASTGTPRGELRPVRRRLTLPAG